MSDDGMHLQVLLPVGVFADQNSVTRIVAETRAGSFGFWPHRLDCVLALTPGILTYQTATEATVFVAVDQGILVKAGANVQVSVRRAVAGTDLAHLTELVKKEYLTLDSQEQNVRAVMAKWENGFFRRLASFQEAQK